MTNEIECKACKMDYPFRDSDTGRTHSNAIKSKLYCSRECEVEDEDFKGDRKCLQIGSGYQKISNINVSNATEEWTNLDAGKETNPDVVCNIEDGLPFEDNTFDIIYSSRCLEHIKPCKFKFVLEEIHRIAKPNAILYLNFPFDNIRNRMDFDHYRCFSWNSFHHAEYKKGRNYYTKFVVKRLNKLPNKAWRILCYLFPLLEDNVYLELQVIK